MPWPSRIDVPRSTPSSAAWRGAIRLGRVSRTFGATAALVGLVWASLGVGPTRDPPSDPPLEASWLDRTRPIVADGWSVRSDLSSDATAKILGELRTLGRRFEAVFGPVGARVRIWCFESPREAADTVRTGFGAAFEGPPQAAYVPDPVTGGEGVIVVSPRGGDASRLREDLARAVADFGVAPRSGVPPWLAHGVVEWFVWEASSAAEPGGVAPPAELRVDLRQAWREGRRLGADRLIRLDEEAWRANEIAGSGALQRAEAGLLTAVLLDEATTRSGLRRLFESHRVLGVSPLARWRSIWPTIPPAALDAAVRTRVDRETTLRESAVREARWFAEARRLLATESSTDDPDELRERWRISRRSVPSRGAAGVEPAITRPCLAPSGRCPMPAPDPVVEWDVLSPDRWSGRAGAWRVAIAWTTLGDLGLGTVSVRRESQPSRADDLRPPQAKDTGDVP